MSAAARRAARSPPAWARTARSPARPASSRRAPCGRRGRARSRAGRRPTCASLRRVGRVEDQHLHLAARGRRASRTSSARRTWCGSASPAVISPPTVTQAPSGLLRELGERAVDRARAARRARRRADGSRGRCRASPSPSAAARRARTRPPGSAGSARRGPRAAARPASSRSKIDPWPESASSCAFCARRLRLAEHVQHALARRAGRVERAALDQALDRLLVDGARVDPRAEVPDRGERPAVLARLEDLLDRRVADVLDRVEAEADVALDDDEVVAGRVHVRRQHARSPSPRSARRRTAPCPWSTSRSRSPPPCTRPGSWPSGRRCGRRSARSRRRATC